MKTITIRVDEELFQQIEEKRGERSKSDFYRSVLVEYISNKPEEDTNKSESILNILKENEKENEKMKTELSHNNDLMRLKDERIRDLQNQLGFLQLEYQKLSTQVFKPLTAPKKWWVFWKK